MKITAAEQEVVALIDSGLTQSQVAEKLGINASNVSRRYAGAKHKALRDGMAPGFEIDRKTEGRWYTDESTGERRVEYLKSKREKDSNNNFEDAFRAAISDIKPLKKIAIPKANLTDIMTVYPMGDPHVGLYAYHKESGEDFDCDIAERDLLAATDYLVDIAPATEEALVVNLGDFFHGDSGKNTTTAGTPVDIDTRWSRVLQIGIKIMLRLTEKALSKHKRVTVIVAPGNHDSESSIVLTIAMQIYFEKNNRVTIQEPNMFHFYEFGSNLIGVCHGHTVKKEALPGLMAEDMPEAWGRTKHRYWYTGHIHHRTLLEVGSSIIESFRTLAGKDAWHHGQGYRAGRDMNAIILHKKYGETDRHRCDILRARA
jgi:transcriptional regulator with XRE-family HTH domain